MLNRERLKIFPLKLGIRQTFPYYHYYLIFYGRYKIMHLDKRKILEEFLKELLSSPSILFSLLFLKANFPFGDFAPAVPPAPIVM